MRVKYVELANYYRGAKTLRNGERGLSMTFADGELTLSYPGEDTVTIFPSMINHMVLLREPVEAATPPGRSPRTNTPAKA